MHNAFVMTKKLYTLTLLKLVMALVRIVLTIFQVILFDESTISLLDSNFVGLHKCPCFDCDDVLIVKRLSEIILDQQAYNLITKYYTV